MRTAVLGAGGWGTALAILWAKRGNTVTLWGHNPERIERLRSTRENVDYLPGVKLPESICLTSNLADCISADLIVFVTPSTALRSVAQEIKNRLTSSSIFLSCTKGIEHGSGLRMSEILAQFFPQNPIAVLSGPNLAAEVSRELPTAAVLGCRDAACAQELQQYLGTPRFRIYSSDETTGIELGGALKNVFAIAAGIGDGFGLGDNSKAALVTRGLAELLRLGTAMGGQARTFYGLSGAGDLVATCFSQLSRNRRVGEKLGQGQSLDQIIASTKTVAEGVPTTKSAFECARRLNIETPIVDQIFNILYQNKKPAEALEELLARDQKSERL
ncbi:MAG: NAD(P)-dependent glycerol-3-phosphate dehydrogenase [Verrucomicrobiota bacterium]|nr:NAD(P)-dependent glycerol-3-phosphate dehydrogenase [Verrucomicrobiota bacterium]MDQ6939405.1 NAD(P)-dependent glycerol-3-phosphate dehydrogenase [Verrucomicrobiota bacterium]